MRCAVHPPCPASTTRQRYYISIHRIIQKILNRGKHFQNRDGIKASGQAKRALGNRMSEIGRFGLTSMIISPDPGKLHPEASNESDCLRKHDSFHQLRTLKAGKSKSKIIKKEQTCATNTNDFYSYLKREKKCETNPSL